MELLSALHFETDFSFFVYFSRSMSYALSLFSLIFLKFVSKDALLPEFAFHLGVQLITDLNQL